MCDWHVISQLAERMVAFWPLWNNARTITGQTHTPIHWSFTRILRWTFQWESKMIHNMETLPQWLRLSGDFITAMLTYHNVLTSQQLLMSQVQGTADHLQKRLSFFEMPQNFKQLNELKLSAHFLRACVDIKLWIVLFKWRKCSGTDTESRW